MADSKNDTDSFIKEVEEDLRRDRIQKLWDAYGTYALVAAAALVIGVYVYKSQESQRVEQSALAGEVYSRAGDLLELGNAEDAMKNFRILAKESPPGYAILSQLRVVGDAVRRGQLAVALKEYDRLARDIPDPILAGYARLQGGLLRVDYASFTEVENHLRPLTEAGSPWRHSALEGIGLAAYKAGRLVPAKREFDRLVVDRQTPAAIRERAQSFLTMIAQGEVPAAPAVKGKTEGTKAEGDKSAAQKTDTGKGEAGKSEAAPAPAPTSPPAPAPDKGAPDKAAKPEGSSGGTAPGKGGGPSKK